MSLVDNKPQKTPGSLTWAQIKKLAIDSVDGVAETILCVQDSTRISKYVRIELKVLTKGLCKVNGIMSIIEKDKKFCNQDRHTQ